MMAEWADLQKVAPRDKRLAQFALSVPLAMMAPASLILEVARFLLARAARRRGVLRRRSSRGSAQLALGVALLRAAGAGAAADPASSDDGLVFTLWALALVWATRHRRLFRRAARSAGPSSRRAISPNKTWAGLIGGVVAGERCSRAALHCALRPAAAADAGDAGARGAGAGRRPVRELAQAPRGREGLAATSCPGMAACSTGSTALVPVAPVAALLVVLPHFADRREDASPSSARPARSAPRRSTWSSARPTDFRVVALTANCDVAKLAAAARSARAPNCAVVADETLPARAARGARRHRHRARPAAPRRCARRPRWAPTGRWGRSSAARGSSR